MMWRFQSNGVFVNIMVAILEWYVKPCNMRKIIILLQGIAFHMLDVLSRSVQTPLLKEIDQSGTHISRVILIENLKGSPPNFASNKKRI